MNSIAALGNDASSSSSWFSSWIRKPTKPSSSENSSTRNRSVTTSEVVSSNEDIKSPSKSNVGSANTASTNLSGTPSSEDRPSAIPPSVTSRLAPDVRYVTDDDEDEAISSTERVNASETSSEAGTLDLSVTKSLGPQPIRHVRHPPRRRDRNKSSLPRRTRRLTTEQVKSLNLQSGENEFTFSLSHQILGTTRLTCRVFVWRWDDRIVVSDIDGTITRSDVLGQVLPIMGYEWTQPGVSRLFSLLVKNNYKILYLSARAIGMAQQTREYLCSIKGLPPGPLLLSPASLVNAFYKEVIEKVPERFKV